MWKRLARPQAIGAVIGAFEGATPGAAGSVAAFLAYNEARRWSKHPEEFGKGSPEGVAAPECANNVVTGTALVPLLGLGIPGSNSAAVLMGGLLLHGLTPGPMLFVKNPDVVYGLYARPAGRQHRHGDPRPGHPHALPVAGDAGPSTT